jgi:four helix bundle protein
MASRPGGSRRPDDYRDLRVWQVSMDLVVESYRVARLLPSSERFGLMPQITGAAVSVPANVAEGNGRLTRGEYRNSLSNARGSLKELETLLSVAERVGHLRSTEFAVSSELCDHVSRMLTNLIRSLRA